MDSSTSYFLLPCISVKVGDILLKCIINYKGDTTMSKQLTFKGFTDYYNVSIQTTQEPEHTDIQDLLTKLMKVDKCQLSAYRMPNQIDPLSAYMDQRRSPYSMPVVCSIFSPHRGPSMFPTSMDFDDLWINITNIGHINSINVQDPGDKRLFTLFKLQEGISSLKLFCSTIGDTATFMYDVRNSDHISQFTVVQSVGPLLAVVLDTHIAISYTEIGDWVFIVDELGFWHLWHNRKPYKGRYVNQLSKLLHSLITKENDNVQTTSETVQETHR